MSALSLPLSTLRLALRFFVPLALWFTVGESIRYALTWGAYEFGRSVTWLPMMFLSLLVVTSLCVAVAMLHSVREGLPAIQERDATGALASWAVGNDESMFDALSRALLPFMVFYLAWGWFGRDAQRLQEAAEARGYAEGDMLSAVYLLLKMQENLEIAVGLTVLFFVLKFAAEFWFEPSFPRAGALAVAAFDCTWTMYGVYTIDAARQKGAEWTADRQVWTLLPTGHIGDFWEIVKVPMLGSLLWLVIAGVVLGVDSKDHHAVLGQGRLGRRLARGVGVDEPERERNWREMATRGLRDMWLPAWYGLRLVKRAGLFIFGTFAFMFVGLDVLQDIAQRFSYELLGAHDPGWWVPRLSLIGFLVTLVFEILRICLLAAAFELVIKRVSERNATQAAAAPSDQASPEVAAPAPPPPPWLQEPSR